MREAASGDPRLAGEESQTHKGLPKKLDGASSRIDTNCTVADQAPCELGYDELLKSVLRLLPVPLFLVDQTHRILFINRAAGRISPDYQCVIGNNISSLFPRRSDFLAMYGLLEGIKNKGQAQITECEIQIGSSRVSCCVFMHALTFQKERSTLIVIEERSSQRAVSVLRETCRKLLSFFPASIAQFRLWTPISKYAALSDLSSNVVNAQLVNGNEEFAHTHGFANLDELRGARFSEFVRPGSHLENTIAGWYDGGLSTYRTVIEETSANRKRAQVEVMLAAEIREDRLVSFWTVKRSLEELNRAEDSLRDIEGRYRAVLDQVNDLILVKERDLRYIDANKAAERLLGLNRSAILGKSPEEIWGRESGARIGNSDLRALEGKASENICIRSTGGVPCTVHLVTTPVRDTLGRIIGLLEVGHRVPGQLRSPTRTSTLAEARSARLPVCNSDVMRKTLEKVWVAAKTEAIVLLLGENGAGKDFLARLIHCRSNRAALPFMRIDGAEVSSGSMESELFGHELGAFKGAGKRKKGLMELADGGTLLIKEIGDLPLPLQDKLLSFLDTKSFSRVGGEKEITADVRILAASSRDLSDSIARGFFRKELFLKLNVLSLTVPPLRERREDLPGLVNQILTDFAERNHLPRMPDLDPSTVKALKDYQWPGNVSELRSVLQRALVLRSGKVIDSDSLGLKNRGDEWTFTAHFPEGESLNEMLEDLKRSLIEEALRRTGGRRNDAANLLGITRSSLKHHMCSIACGKARLDRGLRESSHLPQDGSSSLGFTSQPQNPRESKAPRAVSDDLE